MNQNAPASRTPFARLALIWGIGGFALTAALLGHAAPDALVLHCLPAYRGYEIAAEVIDGLSQQFCRQGVVLFGEGGPYQIDAAEDLVVGIAQTPRRDLPGHAMIGGSGAARPPTPAWRRAGPSIALFTWTRPASSGIRRHLLRLSSRVLSSTRNEHARRYPAVAGRTRR